MTSLPSTPNVIPPVRKQIFLVIWALCILGFFAIIPYSLSLNSMEFNIKDLFSTKIVISMIQNAMLYGLLIFTGLYIARRVGLGVPILHFFARVRFVERRKDAHGVNDHGRVILLGLDEGFRDHSSQV